MRREAFIEESVQGGVAAALWTQHETQHGPRRQIEIKGQTAPPAARSPSRKSTPHYTIGHSTPAEGRGFYTTVRAGAGRGSSMHKEALGGFNQSLATEERPGDLGSGLLRRNGTW